MSLSVIASEAKQSRERDCFGFVIGFCLAMTSTFVFLIVGVPKVMPQETYTNRLAQEKSPYLLQHAHNPVDWYPWGEEAFRKAREEHKPIFLSIGYSTCHWCHVMEEESFVNPEIAKILNEYFVSIKVDREERPDVDHIYMQAVMAMTGSGGWPMSIFLTPDLKPFYGGTYFPPTDKWGRSGFITVLNAIHQKWLSGREDLIKSGEELAQAIQTETSQQSARHELNEKTLRVAYEQLESRFDNDKGGFGEAPKFPQGHILSFLLRYWKRTGESEALQMVEKTLDEMAGGGMYDQIGGGFHRYSTDHKWHVPHFEKMLYDQAILARSYLEAYQATGKTEYARIAREIFDYVLRDMTGPEGAFYSAEDADSAPDSSKPGEKKEGAFYVWSQNEILTALGNKKGEIFNYHFGVEPNGNAAEDPHGEFGGKNILFAARTLEETAKKFGKPESEIEHSISDSKKMLFALRAKRPRPHLDDKVLTDWNGLMILSLAYGARILEDDHYLSAAKRAADFILENMASTVIASPAKRGAAISEIASVASLPRNDKHRRLMHRYREGDISVTGFLEDYAFFANGLFELYEATFDPRYLEEAKFFSEETIKLFWDESRGGFFLTGRDAEKLISRTKDFYDGAIPSGNSIATLALFRIGRLTMDRSFEERAQKTLEAFSAQLAQYPSGFSQMMIALDFAIGPTREIVIAGNEKDEKVSEMIREINSRFLPNQIVVFHPSGGKGAQKIENFSPFVKNQTALEGKATAYVCKNYVCELPVTEIESLKKLLEK